MKRRIAKLCVLVLLLASGGAIVNVAVAWGCAIFVNVESVPYPQDHWSPDSDDQRHWRAVAPMELADFRVHASPVTFVGLGVRSERLWATNYMDGPRFDTPTAICNAYRVVAKAGLPVQSLRGETWYWRGTTNEEVSGYESRGAWVTDEKALLQIPLRPLWPGFAINTVFYAAVLWVLFAFPFTLRRFIRARRGQCPACGYPVGTNEVCTECGRLVLPRRGIGM